MRCTMAVSKSADVLFVLVVLTSGFSASYASHGEGRKLFGGYRIVPKVCQPTIPSRIKSEQPPICMFNYECTGRKGEVVGACMDGFLFGACCQLPSQQTADQSFDKITGHDELLGPHEIDHVPEIPILLNPDGTPVGISNSQSESTSKIDTPASANNLGGEDTSYTKISTFKPSSQTSKPFITSSSHTSDAEENAEKPQIEQADFSNLEEKFPNLLGQQQILDDLSLPNLLTQSNPNKVVQNQHDTENPVTTLLSPDQVFQIADPVDQLPALFSQGLGQNSHDSADTVLLNENGSLLNETHNPDEVFKPNAEVPLQHATNKVSQTTTTHGFNKPQITSTTPLTIENKNKVTQNSPGIPFSEMPTTHWIKFPDQSPSSTEKGTPMVLEHKPTTPIFSKLPVITQMYANTQRLTSLSPNIQDAMTTKKQIFEKVTIIQDRTSTTDMKLSNKWQAESTTPMSLTTKDKEVMVKVPTITYDSQLENKKNDLLDKEEIAINHIISILNNTKATPDSTVAIQGSTSPIHTWVSVDETAKPTSNKFTTVNLPSTTTESFPYTFYKPGQSSTYYNYETASTGSSSYSSYSTSGTYSSRPSTQQSYGSSSSFGYTSKPTTNPPAPTVIVLGPLGTEYTTDTTHRIVTKLPSTTKVTTTTNKPTPVRTKTPTYASTKKPNVSTTITHNISTVITGNGGSNSNQVVSTSYVSVNLKDDISTKPAESSDTSTEAVLLDASPEITTTTTTTTTRRPTVWTTISTWSAKPSFHLKPSNSDFHWTDDKLTSVDAIESSTIKIATTTSNCDKEPGGLADMINFPPVRNPNITHPGPVSQQEKPTIVEIFNNTAYPGNEVIGEDDIPTPMFIEDNELTNKVDTFVNKIVQSLQGNFEDLKDIVYNRKNVTTQTSTKRPSISTTTAKPVRRPVTTPKPLKPTSSTRRPTPRPTSQKPGRPTAPSRPRPTHPSTGKPQVNTGRPQVNTGRPQVNTGRPQLNTGKPQVNAGKPQTSTSKPLVNTGKPQASTHKPLVNTGKPPVNTSKRPKPTKKPTTTTSTSTLAASTQEIDSNSLINATEAPSIPVDYRTECGVRPLVRSSRIVGGKGAMFGKWPWQVLIREATWLGWITKNKCGGVLITNRYVITAAHCQPGFLASLIAVFGEFDISTDLEPKRTVTKNVRRVIVHRGYNPTTFENDLALLELESPVQFDEHIVPVCMPDDNADFTGRLATVTGWGKLKYDGGVPSVLQEVHVPIMENPVCQEMFRTVGHPKLIVDGFMCAGYASGQKDSCEGDSGGPLVMQRPDGRWILVGTVSHGIQCAAPYLPGVYMRMTYYKPWLHSITGV